MLGFIGEKAWTGSHQVISFGQSLQSLVLIGKYVQIQCLPVIAWHSWFLEVSSFARSEVCPHQLTL